jgi:uncharacterized protein YjbJ (UPF0337 family)
MNWDQITGEWKQMRADIKSRWAKLTDDDLQNLSAKKDKLVGKIQERYGVLKEEAERQVDEWLARVAPRNETPTTPESRPSVKDDQAPRRHA